ncbi:peptidoglycan DD-metalloendopeptidase family protein [Dyella sp. OK004]|uniref:peptidoglycan DD-metalloendopeptidase family protein n=1 Tax=Dyella sp. OK004 TaxID=1855292 RepID=UPI000B868E4C|nr:peptidoglycan DD-metalloendopeptidase family protein [Dyella sp. OK004]
MLARMNGYLRFLAPIAAALTLAACVSPRSSVVVEPAGSGRGQTVSPAARAAAPGGTYQVVKGDTLYSIAFRKGVDFRDLASWNGIAAPYTIWPGQTLKLSSSGAASAASASRPVVASHPATVASQATVAAHSTAAASTAPGFQTVPPSPPASSHSALPVSAPVAAAVAAPVVVATAATSGTAPASATSVVPVAGVPTPTHAPPPAATPAPAPVASGATRSNGGVNWRWPADGSLGKRFQSGDAIPGIEILGKSGDPVRAAADGVVVYSGNGLVGYGELVIIKHNDSFLSAYGHNSKRFVKEGQRVSAGQQIAEMGSTGSTRDELQFQIRRDGNPVDPLGYLPSR